MNHYPYHVESELLIAMLDDEFQIVTTVGFPEDGRSPGYDLAIYDSRTKDEIAEAINKVESNRTSKP